MHTLRMTLLGALVVSLGLLLTAGSGTAGKSAVGFGPPIYVDQQLAGGEPEAIMDTLHGKFVYTSHEGTTHLYRDGYTMSPWATSRSSRTTATRSTSGTRATGSTGSARGISGRRARPAR